MIDIVTINDWQFFIREIQLLNGPKMWMPVLYGAVSNHPNFPTGKYIKTSIIVTYDEKHNLFATRKGRPYRLGWANNGFATLYPDPAAFLVKTIYKYRSDLCRSIDLDPDDDIITLVLDEPRPL